MSSTACVSMFLYLLLIITPVHSQTVRMALFQLEPFMMIDEKSGEVTGVTVEYWRSYIAPELGLELDLVGLFPSNRVLKMLENGDIDMIPLLTKIPERETVFLYPQSQLAKIKSCLLVPVESTLIEVNSPDDLRGMVIGFLENAYLPPLFLSGDITIELVRNTDYRAINLKKLLAGRLDAILDINYISIIYYLKKYPHADRIRIVNLPVEDVPVYSVFGKSPAGAMLRDAFDRVNRKNLEDGVFETLTGEFLEKGIIVNE